LIDTTPGASADLDPEWRHATWAGSARLIVALVVLVGLAVLLMAAPHHPGCGGG
jgi:hypothetical protein